MSTHVDSTPIPVHGPLAPTLTTAADPTSDHEQWNWLVSQLSGSIETFADQFVTEFRVRRPYGNIAVSDEDLWDTSFFVFSALINKLWVPARAAEADTDSLHRRLEEFGRHRARSGVPLAAVIEIMQLDFTIVWRALATHSTPQTNDALISNALRVKAAVDYLANIVREAFITEKALLENDARIRTQRHLERLLSHQALDREHIELAARGLGVPADARLHVAVAGPQFARDLERLTAPFLANGSAFGVYVTSCFIVFWEPHKPQPPSEAQLHKEAAFPHLLLTDVDGLIGLRACIHGALALATRIEKRTLDVGRISVRDGLIMALSDTAYRLTPQLFTTALSELRALGDKERIPLIDTVDAYLTEGSIKAAASRVFCHRNTVINRLHTFHNKTGYSPLIPRDAAVIILLLELIRHDAPSESRG